MSKKLQWLDAEGNKRCCRCKQYLPLDQFHNDRVGVQGKTYNCKECACKGSRASHNRRMKEVPEYAKAKRDSYLTGRFGIDGDEYDRRLAAAKLQGCAVCGNKTHSRWHLDHCHTSGRIREFLCGNCNRGLGQFQDREEIMQSAINYLRKHREFSKAGTRP